MGLLRELEWLAVAGAVADCVPHSLVATTQKEYRVGEEDRLVEGVPGRLPERFVHVNGSLRRPGRCSERSGDFWLF